MKLIEATPTTISEIPTGGYLIQFREIVIWQSFSAVVLTQQLPRCVVFMVTLGETGLPQFDVEKERPLTPEEIAHFTKLAKEAERDTHRAEHRRQRDELAKPALINGRLPI